MKVEDGLESVHVKLEYVDADSCKVRSISESPPQGRDQFEQSTGNDGSVFESETVLEFCVKEEENDADLDVYGSAIDTLSREKYRCDEQVSSFENMHDVPYQICNIKQEELEDDDGIIGGFLEDCEADALLESKYDTEELMRESSGSRYPQVSYFILMLTALEAQH